MTTEPHIYFLSQKCKYFWLAIYAAMLTIKSPEPYVLRQPPPPPPSVAKYTYQICTEF